MLGTGNGYHVEKSHFEFLHSGIKGRVLNSLEEIRNIKSFGDNSLNDVSSTFMNHFIRLYIITFPFNTRHSRTLLVRWGFLSVFLYSSHQFLSPPDDERLIRSKRTNVTCRYYPRPPNCYRYLPYLRNFEIQICCLT